ncbi:MAG TPA: DHA2 family efflux MFS transporter permease subunit, partial [Lacisediminihabitans sp.]|uniref:DHA2 family efflux MFS transporter permease subunit n=1 Tax=Lacisediminihabitans sp. TaxID=2787631 RepID=UPI002EDABF08
MTTSVPVPNRWLALAVLSLAQLMDIVDNTIVNIALPSAQRDLGFSIVDRQWVITGYALAFGSLLLIGGRLSDLFGRKRMFIIGLCGFAIASAVGGAATGFEVLLVARVAQGAFAAALAPAALSLLSVTFSDNPTDRGKAFGVFGAISGAGGAIGLLLGGFLTETLSWRWCLYVNLIFAVLAFLGAIVFLRDGTRPARVRFDAAGAVTAVLGLAGIVYGLGNAADHGWTDPVTFIPTIIGVAALIAFVVIERRVDHPLLPIKVVLDRVRGASYLTLGIAGAGTFVIFLFLTYYLQQTLGISPILTGVAFLPMIGCVMIGAVVSGTVLMPRVGPRPLVPAGALLAAIGLALLTRIGTDTGYAATVLPSLLIMGLGFGLIFGPVQNAATSGVTVSDAGVASAMVNTSQQIGGSIGTAVFSSLAALATSRYLATHGTTRTADATIASYHLVFWIA